MRPDSRDILERLHRALVREIRATCPEYLDSPFAVSEIYERLVPYRTHRDVIGAGLSAEYEYVLLRLLSGEGGYVHLESGAREAILRELASPNPNPTVYREFAAAQLRLDVARRAEAEIQEMSAGPEPDSLEVEAGAPGSGPGVSPSLGAAAGAGTLARPRQGFSAPGTPAEPAPGEGGEPDTAATGVAGEGSAVAAGSATGAAAGAARCWSCGEELPTRSTLRFCPLCGVNVRVKPCPACGEELESSWRYCVACGREVAVG
ncbi:MAG: zinc ribbon domain-containing protein [Gemmatimonadetes bacterium]|nr:zinc ribbon domain-containing protein [Gemmatimonadota bacterium]